MSAADLGAYLVGHLTDVARFHGRQDETPSITQQVVDTLFCQLKFGASAGGVLEHDCDVHCLIEHGPSRVKSARGHDAVAVAGGVHGGQQRQGGQEYSDPGDVGEAE